MAREQAIQLMKDVEQDPALKATFNKAADLQKFVEMAQQRGYHFTPTEWKEIQGFHVEELACKLSEIPGI